MSFELISNGKSNGVKKIIYLDNNATTHEHPLVVESMIDYLKYSNSFGNASSSHLCGLKSKNLIEESRESIRSCINAKHANEILFTSGGTESNNLAIQGILRPNLLNQEIQHIITTPFEHPSVLNTFKALQKSNENLMKISFVKIRSNGIVDLDDLRELIRPETRFVSIMHSNNEIGSIQPIEEIVRIVRQCQSNDICIHTDASQSIGKTFVDVQQLGVDLLTICSHKFHGPKGIGALYIRQGIQLEPILFGANHESGRRPGTENLLAILGLAKASQLISDKNQLKQRIQQMKSTRDKLYQGLIQQFSSFDKDFIRINGDLTHCLPNTLSLSLKSIDAKQLVQQLKHHLAFSTGSACHENSKQQIISTTLQTIGLSDELAQGTIRLSTSSMTTEQEIDEAILLLRNAILQQLLLSQHN